MIALNASPIAARFNELNISVVDPTQACYNNDRAVWNARIDCHPAFIAYPTTTSQVAELVLLAQSANLPLAVRGAGHDVLGSSVCDKALVIDLSRMKSVLVDENGNTATAQPGLTIAEFIQALSAQNRIVTFGSHKDVGLAGYTLSGGIGLLMSRYGLLSDNLLSAEIVLADGTIVQASSDEHPDLLWAIRGGGGNFGIVTSLTYRIYPVEPTIAGALVYPIAQAAEGLRFYRDFTSVMPDALTVFAVMATTPTGVPVFTFLCCYTGPVEDGERFLAPLRSFGTPIVDTLAPMHPAGMLEFLAGADPSGGRYAYDTRFLPSLSDDLIDQVVHYGANRTSATSVLVIYDFHGQARRTTLRDSAFPTRDMPYSLGMYASWPTKESDSENLGWLHSLTQAVERFSSGTGPIGLSSASSQESVRKTYREQYGELQRIKTKYDPENVFCHNYNIPPGEEPASAGSTTGIAEQLRN
jgi:FAD binding domain/Berberine and berberine like